MSNLQCCQLLLQDYPTGIELVPFQGQHGQLGPKVEQTQSLIKKTV